MNSPIFNLHDYCFLEVTKYLKDKDLINMALTCTTFNRMVKDLYTKNYDEWKIENKLKERNCIDFATIEGFRPEEDEENRQWEQKQIIPQLENNIYLKQVSLSQSFPKDLVNTLLNKICYKVIYDLELDYSGSDLVLDNLHQFKHLHYLSVYAESIPNLVEVCKANSDLTALKLHYTKCKHLDGISEYCRELQELHIYYDENNDEDYEPLARIPDIKVLIIRSSSKNDTMQRFFKTLASKRTHTIVILHLHFDEECVPFLNLTDIFNSIGQLTSLDNCQITFAHPDQLRSLVHLTDLESLSLRNPFEYRYDVSEEILEILKSCTKLRWITLTGVLFNLNFTNSVNNLLKKKRNLKDRSLQIKTDCPLISIESPYLNIEEMDSEFIYYKIIFLEDLLNGRRKSFQTPSNAVHIKSRAKCTVFNFNDIKQFLRSLDDVKHLRIDNVENICFNEFPELKLLSLDVGSTLKRNELIVICRKFSLLHCLILRDESSGSLKNLNGLPYLRKLQFKTNENVTDYEQLAELPILKEIEIASNHLGGTFLKLFQALSSEKLFPLTKLIIHSVNLTWEEIKEIANIKSLEHLSLRFSDLNGLECLTQLTNLTYLDCEPTLEAYNNFISIPVCSILKECMLLDYIKLYSRDVQLIKDAFEVVRRTRGITRMPLKMIVPEYQWKTNILQDFHPHMKLNFLRPNSADAIELKISNRIWINACERDESEDADGASEDGYTISIKDFLRFTHLEEIELNINFKIFDLIKLCETNQNLRLLKLRNVDIDGNLCNIVQFCPNLEDLQFHTKQNAEEYELLANLPKLKSLTITGDHGSGTFMKLLIALSFREDHTLKSLIIESQYLNSTEMKQIENLKSLEHLSCRFYNPICLEFITKLTSLSSLEIQPAFIAENRCVLSSLFHILKACRNLNTLTINLCGTGIRFFEYAYQTLKRVRNPVKQSPLRMYISDVDFNKLNSENKTMEYLPFLEIESACKLQRTIKDLDLPIAKSVYINEKDIQNLPISSRLIQNRWKNFIENAKYNNYLEVLFIESYEHSYKTETLLESLSKFPVLKKLVLHIEHKINFTHCKLPIKLEELEIYSSQFKNLPRSFKRPGCLKKVRDNEFEGDHLRFIAYLPIEYLLRQIKLDSPLLKSLSYNNWFSLHQRFESLEHLSCHYLDPNDLAPLMICTNLKSLDIWNTPSSDNMSLPPLLLKILRSCPLLEYVAIPYFENQAKFFEEANSVLTEVRDRTTQEPLVIHTNTIETRNFEPYFKIYQSWLPNNHSKEHYIGHCHGGGISFDSNISPDSDLQSYEDTSSL